VGSSVMVGAAVAVRRGAIVLDGVTIAVCGGMRIEVSVGVGEQAETTAMSTATERNDRAGLICIPLH
jgi:hypothetical protein